MMKDNKELLIDLESESIGILMKILVANAVLGIVGILSFFVFSPAPYLTRLSLVSFPIMVCSIFITALLLIHFLIHDLKRKTAYMMLLAYLTYWFTISFYFELDTIPLFIMMGLLYLFVTQILMDIRYTILFGVTGIVASGLLMVFRFGDDLDIGLGFVTAMVYLFAVGIYSVQRYIKLFKQYHDRMGKQLDALKDSEIRHEMIHRASNETIWDFDLKNGIRNIPDGILNHHGDRLSESIYIEDWMKDIHPEDAPELYRQLREVMQGKIDQFEMSFRQVDRYEIATWYSAKVISLKNEKGEVVRLAGSYTEINDKKLKEIEIAFLAYNDVLTKLPNRSAFLRDFELWQQQRESQNAVLIFLDIMNFREFNSTFGHYTGDQLILNISERLKKLPKDLKVYQLTAIDFGLVAFDKALPIKTLTESIQQLFEQSFRTLDQEVFVDVKMGIAQCSHPSEMDAIEMLRNADTALYYCRKDPVLKALIYNKDLTAFVTNKLNMSTFLRQAIDNQEFFVVFQPIVNVSGETLSLYGFETLIRWDSPQMGFVRPDQFIPLAEETGLILPIGELVLRQSCDFIRQASEIQSDITISVNLSAKQIASESFLPSLFGIVDQSGINPANLCLEITETSFIESFEGVKPKLEALRHKGHSIALDDFGTGYSSLNYLGQLDIDTLKIDKSFTQKITDSTSDFYLIKSVIMLSKDLNIKFVAEGVETEAQLNRLKAIGCPLVQGYYYEKPLVKEAALHYLLQFNTSSN